MLPIVLGTYVTQPLLLVLAETPKASAPDRFRARRRQRDLTKILFMGVGTIRGRPVEAAEVRDAGESPIRPTVRGPVRCRGRDIRPDRSTWTAISYSYYEARRWAPPRDGIEAGDCFRDERRLP